jgi:Na+/Pi-cotransporter
MSEEVLENFDQEKDAGFSKEQQEKDAGISNKQRGSKGRSTTEETETKTQAVPTLSVVPQERKKEAFHHRRVISDSSAKALGGSTRSRSRIGSVYRKTGGQIRTITSLESQQPSLPIDHPVAEEATWADVFHACCCHTARQWANISLFFLALFLLLYFFLAGLDLLGTSFAVVGGCTAGSLLGSDASPLSSVMIGIVATAVLQSSSTTSSIIVSLVSGGLEIKQAIYMMMGTSVGTTITSMLVSLAHITDGEELKNAFSASSVYFIYTFLTLVVLFPVELATGYLYELTKAMLPSNVGEGSVWEGKRGAFSFLH